MATTQVSGVRLAGIASAVPRSISTVADVAAIFGQDEAQKISDSIGVQQRHVVSEEVCTSDLCEAAARQLLAELGWTTDSVDALIFVSQTPDYLLPATSCSLHWRLGLSKCCAAFDLNLGCSGYVYGLWVASQLMASGLQRVLLLVGDTISRIVSPRDRSAAPLFGDAGTATALERGEANTPWVFELGTDGSGQEHLMVPAGGFRLPRTSATGMRTEREGGNIRSDEDLFMDGAEIFAFTLNVVPPLFKSVLAAANWTVDMTDGFVMHQANQFMLQHLAKRMKLPSEKVVVALGQFGNTSSASIPLALTHSLAARLRESSMRLLLAGFGVGLSWGAVALICGPIVMPDLVVVDAVAH
jgi:3-oxoacyl-[acyl-carrier-protein] synthase-3